ncbi:MAG: hypothetical protein QW803_13025 [Candidatus Methanomethylicia archaeon]
MMKYITVVDVKNYSLCPMIAYYNNVLHIYERVTETMELGKEIHDEGFLSHLIPKLKAVKVLRNIELTSGRLGLTNMYLQMLNGLIQSLEVLRDIIKPSWQPIPFL